MSTIVTKTLQLGDSGTLSQNFRIKVPTPPDGTLTIERMNGTQVLTIDANGIVKSTANRVAFAATSTQISIPNGLVVTPFTVTSSADFNIGNGFGSNFRFQPTVAGYYQIQSAVSYLSNGIGSASAIISDINKNGVTPFTASVSESTSTGFPAINNSQVIFLNGSSDFVVFNTYHNGSGTATNVSCRASGFLVLPA